MALPFKLDQELPITRGTNGRFREYPAQAGAVPPPPNREAEVPAGGWSPGVGQGTAPMHSETLRFGPPKPPDSGVPYRVSK